MNKTSRILLIIVVVLVVVLAALLLALMPGKTSDQTPDETIATDVTVENAVDPTEKETAVLETEPEATETVPETTEEEIIETEPEVDAPEPGSITYEEYLALEVEVQQAYYEKFETPDDFFAWMNAAKAEQEAATEPQPTVGFEEVEDPTEPAGDIFIDDENGEDWE